MSVPYSITGLRPIIAFKNDDIGHRLTLARCNRSGVLWRAVAFYFLQTMTFGIDIKIDRTVEALAPAEVLGDLAMLGIAATIAIRLQTCEQAIAGSSPWRLVCL